MNVGSLTIDIQADVARIKRDMDETKKAVTGAMQDIDKAVGYAKSALVALGGVTTFAQFVGVIQGGIEARARLYDLHLQTGITVESLSMLGKVGKFSNTGLDEIASASNKLNKAMNTTSEDGKGAAQAIKALGLQFDDFKALSPDQQLVAVANAMEQFADDGGKSATAMLLFGKTGAQLLPFLKELEERQGLVGTATTEAARQAKEYEDNLIKLKGAGEAWKRDVLDVLTPALLDISGALVDVRKEANSFNLTGNVMKTTLETVTVLGSEVAFVFQTIGRNIGAMFAAASMYDGKFKQSTAIADMVKADTEKARADLDAFQARVLGLGPKVSEAMKDTRGVPTTDTRPKLAIDVKEKAAKKEADPYGDLVRDINQKLVLDKAEIDSVTKLTEAQKFAVKVMEEIDSGKVKATVSQQLFVDGLLQEHIAREKMLADRERDKKWLEETGKENDAALESMRQVTNQRQLDAAQVQDQLDQFGLTREQLDALASARLRESAASLKQKAAWALQSGFLQDQADLYNAQASALERTAQLRDRIAAKEATERNDPLAGLNRAVTEYLDKVKRAGDETYGAVANAMGGLEDATTALFTGKGTDAVKAWVNSVISEIIRLQVVRPMLAGIFGGTAGSGGSWGGLMGLFGGGGGGSLTVDTGGMGIGNGTSLADLGLAGGYANGGDPPMGRMSLVGERGPELFVPKSAGTIIPNGALNGGGRVTVNQVLNVGQGVSASQLAQAMEMAKDRAKAEIRDEMRRGTGAYR